MSEWMQKWASAWSDSAGHTVYKMRFSPPTSACSPATSAILSPTPVAPGFRGSDNPKFPQSQTLRLALWISGVGMAVCFVMLRRTPVGERGIPLYLLLLLAAFLLYGAAGWTLSRLQWRASLAGIVGLSALFHLVLVGAPVLRTTDVNRYLWEGRMVLRGVNPLLHPPQETGLIYLRDQNWVGVNNKSIPSIYPTVSQVAFALSAALAPGSVLFWKCLVSICDLAAVLCIAGWLRLQGLEPQRCLLYAWNPLAITEFALNGHQDAIGILFLCAAFYAVERSRHCGRGWAAAAGMAVAASIFCKGYALSCVPFLYQRIKTDSSEKTLARHLDTFSRSHSGASSPFQPRARSMRSISPTSVFVLTTLFWSVVLGLPLFWGWAPASRFRPWSGFLTYASEWERNDSLFHILSWIAGAQGRPGAHTGGLALFVVVWVFLVVRRRQMGEMEAASGKPTMHGVVTRGDSGSGSRADDGDGPDDAGVPDDAGGRDDASESDDAGSESTREVGRKEPIARPVETEHRNSDSTVRQSLAAMGAFLLLSPAVYPWYVIWVLPLAVMSRRVSWLGFGCLVSLDYLHQYLHAEHAWVIALEYLPLAMMLIWENSSLERPKTS